MQEKLKQTELERESLGEEVTALREEISVKKTDSEREARKKDRLEKEMKELKQTLETRQFELKQKQTEAQSRPFHDFPVLDVPCRSSNARKLRQGWSR